MAVEGHLLNSWVHDVVNIITSLILLYNLVVRGVIRLITKDTIDV